MINRIQLTKNKYVAIMVEIRENTSVSGVVQRDEENSTETVEFGPYLQRVAFNEYF